MLNNSLCTKQLQELQQQLIATPLMQLPVEMKKAATQTGTADVAAQEGIRAFLLLEQLALQCYKKPEVRSSATGQISIPQWAFLLAHFKSTGVSISTSNNTTTITTNDRGIAASAFCVPTGRSLLYDARWISPSADPARMHPGLLLDAAARFLPAPSASFDEATESEQRALLLSSAISGPLAELTTDVQAKIGADVSADGGFVVTGVVCDLHVCVTLSMVKIGYRRRHRFAIGAGQKYWHTMFENQECSSKKRRTAAK